MTDPEIYNLDKKVAVIEQKLDDIDEKVDRLEVLITKAMSSKADKTEVEKLAANQSRIAWIIITTVAVAILGLVIKSSTL
jgi:hypothetical protein